MLRKYKVVLLLWPLPRRLISMTYPKIRTGVTMALSLNQKTKECVDHAGHLQQVRYWFDFSLKFIVSLYISYFCVSYSLSISSVETLESYLALKTGEDAIELSAQQITSCTPNPMHCGGTGGCSGSIPEIGFTYSHMMGIVT